MGGGGGGGGEAGSMFRGLEAIFGGADREGAAAPHHHLQPDLAAKFAQIKQEILEAEETAAPPPPPGPAAYQGEGRREEEEEMQLRGGLS